MGIYAPIQLGEVVQVVTANFSAVATGTTVIPIDDTIPQNTEGDQYMTLAITPKSTTNVLIVDVVFQGSPSTAPADVAVALFQDTTANALAATSTVVTTAGYRVAIPLSYSQAAGTTSSTTFKVRAGLGAAGTTTFNGFSSGRIFGAITKSFIKITEYKA